MHELVNQLLSHARAVWYYRWHAVIAAWVIAVSGWILVFMLPDRYEATARVYVDTQSVLKPLLAGLAVQPNVDQQITMMGRTLISRPNLERVVRMADMDIKLKTAEEKERLLDVLTKSIQLKGTGQDNLYTITYTDNKPEDAKRVVQSLLTIFVEGSLGDKRKDSDSAKRFIDEQIRAYEQKLVLAENALKEFKRQHLGMMPAQGRDYVSRLQEAGNRLSQAKLELSEAENSRDALKKELTMEEPPVLYGEPDTPAGAGAAAAPRNPELDARINALKQKLDGLQSTYTDIHPDVIATKRIIAQLEQQKQQDAAKAKAAAQTAGTTPGAATKRGPARNPVMQQLTVALAEAEATVAALKTRTAEYQKQYDGLLASANNVPQIEADLTQLNRDYDVNKKNYETLLARRESAQMSGDMEANAGVLDFRIIDPPRVPTIPVAPNRPLLLSVVLVLACGLGLGLAIMLAQIRPSFHDRQRLQEATGLPILGMVSMKWTAAQFKRRKRGLIAVGASFLSLLSSYGVVMALLFFSAPKA